MNKEEAGIEEEEVTWLKSCVSSLKQPQDVGKWVEVWQAKETRDPSKEGKKRTLIKYRFSELKGSETDIKEQERLAVVIRKYMLKRGGEEEAGPAPPTNNERYLQIRLTNRRRDHEGNHEDV